MAQRIRVLPAWMMLEEPDEQLPSKSSPKSPRKRKMDGDNSVPDHMEKKILTKLVCKVETDGAEQLNQTRNAHQLSDEEEDLKANKLGIKKETLKMEVTKVMEAIGAEESSSSNIVIKKETDETSSNQISDNLHQMSNEDPELKHVKIKNEIIQEDFNAMEINGEAGSSSSNNIVKKEMIKTEINETNVHQISDEEEDSNPNSQDEANGSAPKDSNVSNDASTPQGSQRQPCKYEGNCYRKNPQHREEFSHPGDDDYKDKPECPFGTSCYRKNLLHKQHYKHTKPPQRNATQKPKKQKDSLEDDEDDDYDYDDPFLNDGSSDDYQPTDTGSDDDDDDGSIKGEKEEEENSKRMLKEAKKFTKKK